MADTDVPRTFSKKVGDRTITRTVHTASDEVAAKFEGFVEDAKSSKPASRATSES